MAAVAQIHTVVPEASARSVSRPREALAVEFHGTAREYFRIWIVNLCLTLLTLGVFSAWAKVRKKRYFYSHTTLGGTPLQYLGEPIPILKGRVAAALLFVLYYLSSNIFTTLLPYVLVLATALAPWVIVKSAAFNARYSAFRNMTFRFEGDYWGALRALYWLGMIPALVVGTIFNWWGHDYAALALYGIFALLFPWWLRRLKAFVIDNTCYGSQHARLSATGSQFFKIYFVAGLIIIAAGLVVGAGVVLTFRLSTAFAEYAMYAATALIYAAYVGAYAVVNARSGNLVWNQTRLGPVGFKSTLHGGELTKLYITNAVAIIASAGLLIPWAVVRTLRYRIDHIEAETNDTLRVFQGDEAAPVRAAGAELGEFFAVDLSL